MFLYQNLISNLAFGCHTLIKSLKFRILNLGNFKILVKRECPCLHHQAFTKNWTRKLTVVQITNINVYSFLFNFMAFQLLKLHYLQMFIFNFLFNSRVLSIPYLYICIYVMEARISSRIFELFQKWRFLTNNEMYRDLKDSS